MGQRKVTTETIKAYRACFDTQAGRIVLGHLLGDMGLFDENISNPEDVAVRNYAATILTRLGVNPVHNVDNLKYFADVIMEAPHKE